MRKNRKHLGAPRDFDDDEFCQIVLAGGGYRRKKWADLEGDLTSELTRRFSNVQILLFIFRKQNASYYFTDPEKEKLMILHLWLVAIPRLSFKCRLQQRSLKRFWQASKVTGEINDKMTVAAFDGVKVDRDNSIERLIVKCPFNL
ncbi:hypothetical protein CEXT_155601 [Caerostris extrusa]|uniref:Uncharacterized protein n=1 Tax=Caerostris extrusa TaxID=172846 RepID=A0AAV4V9P5_CAEEX|nr:hypothetical protein CEXT_155601 [Caerostris extrusa]